MADTGAEIVQLVEKRTRDGEIRWGNRYPERPPVGASDAFGELMAEDVFTAEFVGPAGKLFLVLRSPRGTFAATKVPSLTLQDANGGSEKVLWAVKVPKLLALLQAVREQEAQLESEADKRFIDMLK